MVSIDRHEDVPRNNNKALMKIVANQPISIAIDVGDPDFQLYSEVKTWTNQHKQVSWCFKEHISIKFIKGLYE